MSITKIGTARKEYRCADCRKPIAVGERYATGYEYGEKIALHESCAQKRPAMDRSYDAVRNRGS